MTTLQQSAPAPDGIRIFGGMGSINEVLLSADQTNGAASLVRIWVPPAWANPPHVHWYEDEMFYVLEGEIDVTLDGHTTRLTQGQSAFGPRRIPHQFANPTDQPAVVLVTVTPGGFERFFKAVHDASASDPPSTKTLVTIIERHGMSVV